MKQFLHAHHTLRRQMGQAPSLDLVRIAWIERFLAVFSIKELHTVPPAPVERCVESFVTGSHEFESRESLDLVEEFEGEYLPALVDLPLVEYQLRSLGFANPKSVWRCRRDVFGIFMGVLVPHDSAGIFPGFGADFRPGNALGNSVFVLLPYMV